MKISTKVMVTVVVESGPVWGPEWQVGEVRKRAAEDAKLAVRRALQQYGSMTAVGEPKVQLVIVSEDGDV